VNDVYGMKTDKQLVNTLEDVIQKCVAHTKLISDHALVEINNRVFDIFCALVILDTGKVEPHYQNQNFAKHL